jgi:hypothetical protein
VNVNETARILGEIALYDNRKVDAATVAGWHRIIGHLAYADTSQAVVEYFGESSDYLKPADLIRRVKAIREDRLGPAGPGLHPAPPAADPDDVEGYLRALRAQQTRVADGTELRALPAGDPVDGGDPWDTPTVRNIRARFEAEQEAARKRKAAERQAEREATRAYIDAQEALLALEDLGESALAAAWEQLFGEEQAAAGFPIAADALGVTDQQKTTIRAAAIAKGEPPWN